MMIIHADAYLKTVVGKLNHPYFGWVEDAQGFVFMSGPVVGLGYGGRYIRHGYDGMSSAIWKRIRTIYSHQLFLIALFLVAALITCSFAVTPKVIDAYLREPIILPLLSAILVTGSMHMGILPMYIVFLAATPFAFRLLKQERYLTYVAVIALLWMVAQSRLPDLIVLGLENEIASAGHKLNLGIFFNVFGWQVLFFAGLAIGYLMAAKKFDPQILWSPDGYTAFLVCIGVFLFLGIYDRIIFDFWFGNAFSQLILGEADRGNFSFIYLIAFAADLYIVAWLLGPGVTAPQKLWRVLAQTLVKLMTLRPLVFLGQHSLHVFTAHIVLIYILAAVFQNGPPSAIMANIMVLLSPAPLFLVAWLHALFVKKTNGKPG
jgi:hypothetical protein